MVIHKVAMAGIHKVVDIRVDTHKEAAEEEEDMLKVEETTIINNQEAMINSNNGGRVIHKEAEAQATINNSMGEMKMSMEVAAEEDEAEEEGVEEEVVVVVEEEEDAIMGVLICLLLCNPYWGSIY